METYAHLSHLGTLAGSSSAAVEFLQTVAQQLRPEAERKLQLLHEFLPRDGDRPATLEPWDLDWAEQQQQEAHFNLQDDSFSGLPELAEVTGKLSAYLEDVMGITLRGLGQLAPTEDAEEVGVQQGSSEGSLSAALRIFLLNRCSVVGEHPQLFFSVCHELHGEMGWLVLDPSAGYGTRIMTHGSRGAASLPIVLVGLSSWPRTDRAATSAGDPAVSSLKGATQTPNRQQQRLLTLQQTNALGSGLFELMHEMGHALHFLASSNRSDSTSGGQVLAIGPGDEMAELPFSSPFSLPLELLEVPSSLYENLAMQPKFIERLLPQTSAAFANHLADHIRSSVYCPIRFLVQVGPCFCVARCSSSQMR